MEPVRLAIIGGGVIGRRHAGAISMIKNAKLVAICDPGSGGRQLAEDMGVALHVDTHTLFAEENVDGVIVSTPTEHHFLPTVQALDAGCHVLVEKPITATLSEADQIISKASDRGRHVLVGHHRRYYSLVHKAREIVQSGELGQVVAVNGQWTVRKAEDYYESSWRKKWKAGPILTNLIHELDSLRYICGDVHSICAEISNEICKWEKEDAAAVILRFMNGAIGTFIISDQATSPWAWELATGETAFFPYSGQNTLRFMGTKAALDFPNLTLWHHGDCAANWNQEIKPYKIKNVFDDAFSLQIQHFLAVILKKEQPLVSAVDGRATLHTTLAVFESANRGNKVIL